MNDYKFLASVRVFEYLFAIQASYEAQRTPINILINRSNQS